MHAVGRKRDAEPTEQAGERGPPRGVAIRPDTTVRAGSKIVSDCGRRTDVDRRALCQYADAFLLSTADARCPGVELDAVTFQPRLDSAGAKGIQAAFGGRSMCAIADEDMPLLLIGIAGMAADADCS